MVIDVTKYGYDPDTLRMWARIFSYPVREYKRGPFKIPHNQDLATADALRLVAASIEREHGRLS